MVQVIDSDVLVIGGGGAAARAALEARRLGASVVMVMKGSLGRCGTTAYRVAEIAGYNAADGQVDPGDNPQEHLKDILGAAAGMCDERLASILAHEAPSTLSELEAWNVPLEKDGDRYVEVLGCFATRPRMHIIRGHSEPVLAAMVSQIREGGVKVVENTLVMRLLVQDGTCVGAVGIGKSGDIAVFRAGAVAMGTGGAGGLFMNSLNPPDVVGDGYALAYRAGADLVNMEFMQSGPGIIHPVKNTLNAWTWMLHPRMYNAQGDEFLARYLPPGMTAEECMDRRSAHYPFSTYDGSHWIDASIHREILAGRGTPEGGVYLDFTGVSEDALPSTPRGDDVRRMWATTRRWLLEQRHLDVMKEPIQVATFGHAINGGMAVDEHSETSVRGLFAAGEAAGGPHGADRLGGNMVNNLMVFGRRMGRFASERAREGAPAWQADDQVAAEEGRIRKLLARTGEHSPHDLKKRIQRAMWAGLLMVRNEEKLVSCLREMDEIAADWRTNQKIGGAQAAWQAIEVENMLQVGEIMARSALLRTESRGSHYREDYPQRDDATWTKSILARRADGEMQLSTLRLPTLKDSAVET